MMFYHCITVSSMSILRYIAIKDDTDAPKWDNYLDLHLEFDEDGKVWQTFHRTE